MIEPVDKALELGGTTMEFPAFSIKGIVGFNIVTLYKGEQSLYEIEKQNFSFQTTSKLVADNAISIDDRFEISDGTSTYTFEITRVIPDMIGWSELHCDYISGVLL